MLIRRKKPEGYKELLVYRRATELQDFIYKVTESFPITERRRKEHMRDSARSVKQNIVEGWKRETTQQYIDFLSFSFGSLGELKQDGEDCIKRNLISNRITCRKTIDHKLVTSNYPHENRKETSAKVRS